MKRFIPVVAAFAFALTAHTALAEKSGCQKLSVQYRKVRQKAGVLQRQRHGPKRPAVNKKLAKLKTKKTALRQNLQQCRRKGIPAGSTGSQGAGNTGRETAPEVPAVDIQAQPPAAPAAPVMPPIPELATWQQQMLSYGKQRCADFSGSMSNDEKLANTYYDAAWVFYQIGDYTGDSSWFTCAKTAEAVYRDTFVMPANGGVPGYWNFTRGLVESWLRTGDEQSKQAAILLSQNGAFNTDSTTLESTQDGALSREVAYAIMGYLNSEDLGQPRRTRLAALVDQAFDHLDQFFTGRAAFVKPFMVALTGHALIKYNERVGDARTVPALVRAADWLWDNTWVPEAKAFLYIDRDVSTEGAREPAPDLNLLIAPLYAWLYRQTGEQRFLDRGDQIFQGGVNGAWLVNGKQFNQSYRASFDYVAWRGGK